MEVNASLINFAAGQLSKKFLGRTDLPNFYKAGLLKCQNFIPQAQGPVKFRSGSKYVMHTRLHGVAVQYPFIFNDDQAYALTFTDKKLRFFSDGGVIFDGADTTAYTLLSHFNGVDGATAYTAETGQVFTFAGTAQLDTAQKKFGLSSLLLDGNSDYVTLPDSPSFNFGSGEVTFACWVRFASVAGVQTIFSQGVPVNHYGALRWNGTTTKWEYYYTDPSVSLASAADATIAINTWYHIALVRKGNVWTLYRDGVAQASGTYDVSLGSSNIVLGYDTVPGTNFFNGWIDEPIFVQGTALWGAGFVPPSAEYGSTNSKIITAITAASPGVITSVGHGYSTGDEIYISGIVGMTTLNNKFYLVVNIGADTYSLTDVDGTAIDTTLFTAYTSGGITERIYEIDTPYAVADIDGLQFAQKADLMYIVHPNYEPRKLIRSGDASWALSLYTRTADPFTKDITGITAANPGVVTSNGHGFVNGDIVEIWSVVGMTQVNGCTFKVANKAANTFELTDPVTGANIDTSGYTAYSSGGHTFLQGNMPGAVAFYAGRLFFAGTDEDPESFWGSKAPTNAGVTQYDDFTVGANAGDAVTFPISSQNNTADRIQWLAGVSKFLGLGTFGGVYKANGGSDTTPISGTAIAVQSIEFVGCRALAPVRLGNALFYVQRGGLALNKFAFSLLADDFRSSNLNIFSDEIVDSGIVQLAVQQGEADIIWCVMADGRLLGVTIRTDEEITAWHEHLMGGKDVKVLSACGEPQEDNRDSLWLVVERTVNSLTRRHIEYFSAEDFLPEPEDYFTGVSATDDLVYRRLLYEAAKQLVRVDSSLTLDTVQTIGLTPGATTGSNIAFTAAGPLFATTDVGRYIVKKAITGTETGIAKIVSYTSNTVVGADILETFDSVTAIANGGWYLSVSSVTGLEHQEGETVQIQIDGADGGTAVVASGAITLDGYGTVIHVGPSYTGRLQTMPLDIGALVGTAQAKITTVNRLGLLVRHTLGTKFGTDLYHLEQVESRDVNEHFDRPPALVTDVLFLNLPDGYDRRKCVHIVQDSPFPCTVQGIIPYVDTTNE